VSLPSSPASSYYRELIAEFNGLIASAEKTRNLAPDRAMDLENQAYAMLASQAELDFWAYCRFVTSMKNYVIRDVEHDLVGTLYIEHPWIFDRCRDIQHDTETREMNRKFYQWPRYHLKTTLITQHHTTWETSKDPSMTTAILTFKVDQVGEAMFNVIRVELRDNPFYSRCWPDVWPENESDWDTWTSRQVTVNRPPGGKEPTISIHSLSNMPVSWHLRRIKIDDAEVRETVQTQASIASALSDLRNTIALGSDDTIRCYIGTIWDLHGPWMQADASGMFSSKDHWAWDGFVEKAA